MRRLLPILCLAGCLISDQRVDDYLDRDGDGEWTSVHPDGTDCDDANAEAHTRSIEICDGIDNDCDGEIDEPDAIGAREFYVDRDGDGWAGEVLLACVNDLPLATAGWELDCDDAAPEISPGTPEICGNGLDDDCSGNADDGPDVAWVQDLDGDGWGVGDSPVWSCEPVPNLGIDGDCDDGNPAVHPHALDRAYDGLDADCAGDDDFDLDGDGYRVDPSREAVSDTDYVPPPLVDCDDRREDVYPGAIDRPYDGVDADCAGDDDFDSDGDGEPASPWGEDCDDGESSFDIPGDGVDQDCDGSDTPLGDGVGVFVAASGSDHQDCGGWDDPCATVIYAHDLAVARSLPLFVGGGMYEAAELSVSLFGGFDPITWTRSPHTHPTHFRGRGQALATTGSDMVVSGVTLGASGDSVAALRIFSSNTRIEDTVIVGTALNDCYGIEIVSGDVHLNRVHIESCDGTSNVIGVRSLQADSNHSEAPTFSIESSHIQLRAEATHIDGIYVTSANIDVGHVQVDVVGPGSATGINLGSNNSNYQRLANIDHANVRVQGGDTQRAAAVAVNNFQTVEIARSILQTVGVPADRDLQGALSVSGNNTAILVHNNQWSFSGYGLSLRGVGLSTELTHLTMIGTGHSDRAWSTGDADVLVQNSALVGIEWVETSPSSFHHNHLDSSCLGVKCTNVNELDEPSYIDNTAGDSMLETGADGILRPSAGSPLIGAATATHPGGARDVSGRTRRSPTDIGAAEFTPAL